MRHVCLCLAANHKALPPPEAATDPGTLLSFHVLAIDWILVSSC